MRLTTLRILLPLMLMPAIAGCDDPTSWRDALPMNWYYVASTSMEPTLSVGERFTAASVNTDDLNRGDIVIVQTSWGEDYLQRITGLPNDTIALQNGIVFLNGEPVEQKRAGRYAIEDDEFGPQDFQRLKEQFPGEDRPHFILDTGPSLGDDYQEVTLGEDQYFLLGDNRDNAADSRFGEVLRGLDIVPSSQITRKVAASEASD